MERRAQVVRTSPSPLVPTYRGRQYARRTVIPRRLPHGARGGGLSCAHLRQSAPRL